jgi:hypothetical protein
MTFGGDAGVTRRRSRVSVDSWRTCERYTGNLGIGTLTDIIPRTTVRASSV